MNGARREAVLGVDVGTGSVKAVAFSVDGLEVLGRASAPLSISSPRAGWAEGSPQDWLDAAGRAVRQCLEGSGDPEVLGVGLSGQMHGVVLCRRDGTPIRPAVLWADTRSSEEVARLRAAPSNLRSRLANPLVTGMAAPTLGWLLRHEPDAVGRATWALQPKDWLRLKLTGEAATEPSDASATLLWDLPGDRWCEEVFDLFRIPRRLVVAVRPSEAVAGLSTSAQSAVPRGLRVVHGGADTACALFGTDPLPPQTAHVSVGTGAQVVAALDSPEVDHSGRTHLYRRVLPGSWYAMGAVQNAGLALERAWRWLGVSWDEAYALLAEASPGAAGLTFVPHLSGERTPYVDPTLRGGWVGLGLEHSRADLVRSAFEGVAFAIRDALDALKSAGREFDEVRLVGGGSRNSPWRQLLADVLGLPLTMAPQPEASARGAARLACLGLDIPADMVPHKPGKVVKPANSDLYEEAFARFHARLPVR
jgi:xylulokinase